MNPGIRRLAAVAAAGSLVLTLAGGALAASPAPLTLAIADTTAGPTTATGNAHVRVVHGSPDAPEVDVYAGATLAAAAKVAPLSGLSFGDVSAYADVPSGTYAIKVCATAAPTVCPIEVPSIALSAETYYTIAASDLLAQIKATVFTDTPVPSDSGAQVRVYHLSANTPAVDVLTAAGADISPALDNLAYPNASGYLTLPAASYDVKVCAHASHAVCPIGPATLDLSADHTYSVFAIGSLAGPTPTAPATSTIATVGSATPADAGSFVLFAIAAVAAAGFAGSLALVTVRNRR